jgi:hypothetical protein
MSELSDKQILEHVEKVTREYLDNIREALLLQIVGLIMEEKAKAEKKEGSIENFL